MDGVDRVDGRKPIGAGRQRNSGPEDSTADRGIRVSVSFHTPIGPSDPRYSLLLVSEPGLSDIVAQVLLEPLARITDAPALDLVRGLRASQELAGAWQTTVVDLHLN